MYINTKEGIICVSLCNFYFILFNRNELAEILFMSSNTYNHKYG